MTEKDLLEAQWARPGVLSPSRRGAVQLVDAHDGPLLLPVEGSVYPGAAAGETSALRRFKTYVRKLKGKRGAAREG